MDAQASSSSIQSAYPARYYARYDTRATQPTPVTGWYDVWALSIVAEIPAASDMIAISAEDWANTATFRVPLGKGVQEGRIIDYAPPVAAPDLAALAKTALSEAQAATWARFGSRGKTVSQDWIAYQDALDAIIDGSDTTNTVLPSLPTS